MNFAIILAAGSGTRLKSSKLPKQFLTLDKQTIIELVVEKFLLFSSIDYVLVVVPSIWYEHSKDLLKKYESKILMCEGGRTRQESLYLAIKYLQSCFKLTSQDKIISHDVARPFVSWRIIEENIKGLDTFSVIDTVIPSTDTIIKSEDGELISEIPNRSMMYQGQTPQSFYALDYLNIYEKLDESYLSNVTDAAKIFLDNGFNVGFVYGSEFNLKITTDYDLMIAKYLLGKTDD